MQLTQVQTQQADPPEQVIDAFRDVQLQELIEKIKKRS